MLLTLRKGNPIFPLTSSRSGSVFKTGRLLTFLRASSLSPHNKSTREKLTPDAVVDFSFSPGFNPVTCGTSKSFNRFNGFTFFVGTKTVERGDEKPEELNSLVETNNESSQNHVRHPHLLFAHGFQLYATLSRHYLIGITSI